MRTYYHEIYIQNISIVTKYDDFFQIPYLNVKFINNKYSGGSSRHTYLLYSFLNNEHLLLVHFERSEFEIALHFFLKTCIQFSVWGF